MLTRKITKLFLITSLLFNANLVLSMDSDNRLETANKIAVTLSGQTAEIIKGSLQETRSKLEDNNLLDSYRLQTTMDIALAVTNRIIPFWLVDVANNFSKALVDSELTNDDLNKLLEGMTSSYYIAYHVQAVKTVKAAIQGAPIPEVSLNAEQTSMADALLKIPGYTKNEQSVTFSRYIASEIQDGTVATQIATFIMSHPYQTGIAFWSAQFPK